jgi:hypothetical protein
MVHGMYKRNRSFRKWFGSHLHFTKNGFFASKKVSHLHGVAERTNRFRTSVSPRLCPLISSLLRKVGVNSDGRNDSYMERLLTARRSLRQDLRSLFLVGFERKGTGLFHFYRPRDPKVKILHIKAKIGSTRMG